MDQGIDIRRQKVGTTIYVECATQLFEIEIIAPECGGVRVNSNEPVLRVPIVGQLVQSVSTDGTAKSFWIGRGMAMQLRFRNGLFVSQLAIAAGIKGQGWSYDVFSEPTA